MINIIGLHPEIFDFTKYESDEEKEAFKENIRELFVHLENQSYILDDRKGTIYNKIKDIIDETIEDEDLKEFYINRLRTLYKKGRIIGVDCDCNQNICDKCKELDDKINVKIANRACDKEDCKFKKNYLYGKRINIYELISSEQSILINNQLDKSDFFSKTFEKYVYFSDGILKIYDRYIISDLVKIADGTLKYGTIGKDKVDSLQLLFNNIERVAKAKNQTYTVVIFSYAGGNHFHKKLLELNTAEKDELKKKMKNRFKSRVKLNKYKNIVVEIYMTFSDMEHDRYIESDIGIINTTRGFEILKKDEIQETVFSVISDDTQVDQVKNNIEKIELNINDTGFHIKF